MFASSVKSRVSTTVDQQTKELVGEVQFSL
jgi:hypothetical protein